MTKLQKLILAPWFASQSATSAETAVSRSVETMISNEVPVGSVAGVIVVGVVPRPVVTKKGGAA